MKIIEQSYEILTSIEGINQAIEVAGRTCYKSEDNITPDSSYKFTKSLIKRGHEAMIEFGDITIRFITNRGVTHELVRHRLCSFAQESTRYVKYGNDMEFIRPVWWASSTEGQRFLWKCAIENCRNTYTQLLDSGWQPQQAREVLPNSLKTEIVVKANIREWRQIFRLRCAKTAHPQMRELMCPCLKELRNNLPIVFDDIEDNLN
jgi:thymidylate synthase (FAD)